MAQYSVDATKLQNYIREMIRFVIKNHKSEVVNLLQMNGVRVPPNADDKTIHAMVLQAMVSSNSFKNGLVELVSSTAMEGVAAKAKYTNVNGKWANQDGSDSLISNDTINGLVTTGINTLAYNLTSGGVGGSTSTNANIKNEVNAPASAPPKSNNTVKIVVVTTVVVAVSAFVIWKIIKKPKPE